MANKHDIVTFYQSMAAGLSYPYSIGGAVPSGKTRFVTFIRVEKTALAIPSSCTGLTGVLGVASNLSGMSAISTTAAMLSGAALPLYLAGVSAVSSAALPRIALANQVPDRPDISHPILSVGTGKYIYFGIGTSGPAASLFCQYYDE